MKKVVLLQRQKRGALAQLARALAWHARGHRFDSVMLHTSKPAEVRRVFLFMPSGVPFLVPYSFFSYFYRLKQNELYEKDHHQLSCPLGIGRM